MGERETQLDRDPGDVGVSVDGIQDADATGTGRAEPRRSASRTDRLRAKATSLFSPRAFAVTAIVALVGYLVVGGLLPLGGIAGLLGIAVGTFATGLVGSESRYGESAVAGTAVAGGAAFLDHLVLTLAGLGVPLLALGAIAGFLAGAVGHYFGRDLRTGLTREI